MDWKPLVMTQRDKEFVEFQRWLLRMVLWMLGRC